MASNEDHVNAAFEPDTEDPRVNENKAVQNTEDKSNRTKNDDELLYTVDDTPNWYISIVLGLQHCFLSMGGLIGTPLILAPKLCMFDNEVGYLGRTLVISSMFFTSGIITFLQTTFGTRLPIMQGSSFSFLPPALAILALPQNQCPSGPINTNLTNGTLLYNDTDGSIVDGNELWYRRMRQVQGAIAVASVLEIILGLTGAVGFLMRFIGPLTVAPAIALIGIALVEAASHNAAGQWGIAMFTAAVLIICSQYLRNVTIPYPNYNKSKGCHVARSNFFKLFPVLIAIVLSWILCLILTKTNVFPDDPKKAGYSARTDYRISVLHSSPWLYWPYPGQWGLPVVLGAGVVGMLAGVIVGIVESIGDYYACARLAGAPPIPNHALNRGLTIEGLGCLLAGVIGTGSGTTSFSENVGAIGITRVGSRRVLQVTGVVFFFMGIIGKIGAVFVLIPDPILGGLFCVMFGMVTAVGLSNLQYFDLNSSRNLFILGFSIFMGILVPGYIKSNPRIIDTGVTELDQIFTILLETSMFIGGLLGALLDNTIPGTREERGIDNWTKVIMAARENEEGDDDHAARMTRCYNLPFSTDFRFSRYIPIFPEFGRKRILAPNDE